MFNFTDGIVGDVLFWSLRKCIGHEYDFPTHRAWVRIFSAMLKVRIMPSLTILYLTYLTYTYINYIHIYTYIYIHIYIIQVIVPVALQYELRNGEAQIDRLRVAQEEKPTEVSRASVASTM